MADAYWVYSCLLILSFIFLSNFISRKDTNGKTLPRSAPSLPIISHLPLLKEPLHRTLQKLSEKYGDILYLKFGSRKVIVISSPSAVEECFTKNDIVFANRLQVLAGKHLNYNYKTVAFASYGDHWRNMRRLTALEVYSTQKLNAFSYIRREEVLSFVNQLFETCKEKQEKVELKSAFTNLSFNIMTRILAGKRYCGKDAVDNQEARQFRDLIKEVVELQSISNLGDFLPVAKWVDIQGVEKRMVRLMKKMDSFLQCLVEEGRSKNREYSSTFGSNNVHNEKRRRTLIEVMFVPTRGRTRTVYR